MSKPWKGLLAALTSFVCFAADLSPHRPGSLSLKCQPFLRPNPPPMGVAGGGGWGKAVVSKLDQHSGSSSFNCGEGAPCESRMPERLDWSILLSTVNNNNNNNNNNN